VSPRPARTFKRIPYRKHGYGTQRACDLLAERGYPITVYMLRTAADSGEVASYRSPGRHRRFMALDLEQFLRSKA